MDSQYGHFIQCNSSAKSKNELAQETGVDAAFLETVVRLADLTRVQWVSPTVARLLLEAGYDSASGLLVMFQANSSKPGFQ